MLTGGPAASHCPKVPELILLVEEAAVHIRPELLEDERAAIQADIHDPALSRFGPGALLGGVIEIGDSGSAARSQDLGEVRSGVSRVGPRDQDPAERVS